MSTLKFTVVASNPSNEGTTHVWKLVTEPVVECFGIKKTVKRTFYIGGMPVAGTVGTNVVENMDKFNIVEREFITPDGEKLMLKWLHAKPY